MPCNSEYLRPTDREEESGRVLEFLKEVHGQKFDHDNPDPYGKVEMLDLDTDRLCRWLREHPELLPNYSLELQLWWQRHQRADARRQDEELARANQRRLRAKAIAKLTPEELAALKGD